MRRSGIHKVCPYKKRNPHSIKKNGDGIIASVRHNADAHLFDTQPTQYDMQ